MEEMKDIFADLIREGHYSQVVFGDKKVACRPFQFKGESHIHGLAFFSLKNPKLDDNVELKQEDIEYIIASMLFKDRESVDVVIEWLKSFKTNVFGLVV